MASQLCRGCLSTGLRRTPRALLLHQLPSTSLSSTVATSSLFHTSAARYANPMQKKSKGSDNSPKFRESKSARMRKPKKTVDRGRPPAVGERKALRKRIVLSNTNALEVQGMLELSRETMVDSRIRGSMLSLPMPMVTQLRALQAFKPSQGWSLFRRPAVVLRRETLELGRLFENMTDGAEKGKVVKRILTGKRASGKSVHLLQAMAMAILKKWVVISIPEPQEFVIAHSAYAPLPGTDPVQYVQEKLTSELLHRTALANEEILSNLHVSMEHPELKSLIRPQMNLNELARLGVQDVTVSWPVFQALWAELNATNAATSDNSKFTARPPLLVTVDGLAHWMQDSKYRNADFKPIHAHNLTLVNHFLSLLTPKSSSSSSSPSTSSLANGGILLYSTSGSNNPTVPTFDFALDQLRAHQNGVSESSPEYPRLDPYCSVDQRVLDLFQKAPSKGGKKEGALEVQTLGGLSREEARGFMEYFARSGILQEKITEEFVCEKWSLAGGGIIGEMEKLGKRLRTVL